MFWIRRKHSFLAQAPELIAHRGYALAEPENTLPALQAAAKAGARFVEVDVQLSRDKVPFLFHDRRLARLCGQRGNFYDLNSLQVRALRVCPKKGRVRSGSRVPVASLEDLRFFLKKHPNIRAFVEAKPESVQRFGPALVLEKIIEALGGAAAHCILISFSEAFLREARMRSRLPLGLILKRWRQQFGAFAREIKPEYLFCDTRLLPRWGRIASGKPILCLYEVRQLKKALALARRGAHMIETMAIKEMLEALRQ